MNNSMKPLQIAREPGCNFGRPNQCKLLNHSEAKREVAINVYIKKSFD